MKEYQRCKVQVPKNKQCKLIEYQYQLPKNQKYKLFNSPTPEDLHLQELAKVGRPFTQSVYQLFRNFNKYSVYNQLYTIYRGFSQDESSIPKSFKLSCKVKRRYKCKASFYYVFNEEQRFYYLEYAQNLHYHEDEEKKIVSIKPLITKMKNKQFYDSLHYRKELHRRSINSKKQRERVMRSKQGIKAKQESQQNQMEEMDQSFDNEAEGEYDEANQ